MNEPRCPIYGLLDNIRSAHNVGSMFRTADAVGMSGLFLCGITATPPRADLEKTALGAQRSVPWDYWPSTEDAVRSLRERGFTLVALECDADAVPYDEPLGEHPICFVVGNEVDGVGPAVQALCHRTAMIPMHGAKESLNVAVSFGVMAYAMRAGWDERAAPSRRWE